MEKEKSKSSSWFPCYHCPYCRAFIPRYYIIGRRRYNSIIICRSCGEGIEVGSVFRMGILFIYMMGGFMLANNIFPKPFSWESFVFIEDGLKLAYYLVFWSLIVIWFPFFVPLRHFKIGK